MGASFHETADSEKDDESHEYFNELQKHCDRSEVESLLAPLSTASRTESNL
jgi:hypothetical protein